MQNDEKDSGATPRRSQEAGSIAPDVAPHVAKHTPGPWSIEEVHDHEILIASAATPADGEWTVASVWRDCAYLQETATRKANAHLIAAAPELLEACRGVDVLYAELHSAMPSIARTPAFDLVTQAVNRARAAIAKAEGRE